MYDFEIETMDNAISQILYYVLKSFLLKETSTVSIFLITFPEIMNREEISFKKSANSCVTKEA